MTSSGGFASSSFWRSCAHLFFRAGIAFAQFALDRLHLLAQISAALRVGELRLHVLLQLLLDLRDLELRRNARLHRARRFSRSFSSSSACFAATSMFRLGARKSVNSSASSSPSTIARACSGTSGVSSSSLAAESRRLRKAASNSFVAGGGSVSSTSISARKIRRRLRDLADRETPQSLRDDDDVIVRLAQ